MVNVKSDMLTITIGAETRGERAKKQPKPPEQQIGSLGYCGNCCSHYKGNYTLHKCKK